MTESKSVLKRHAVQISVEQQARDMLERMEIEGAQSFSAGEIGELANLINDNKKYEQLKAATAQQNEVIAELAEALRWAMGNLDSRYVEVHQYDELAKYQAILAKVKDKD